MRDETHRVHELPELVAVCDHHNRGKVVGFVVDLDDRLHVGPGGSGAIVGFGSGPGRKGGGEGRGEERGVWGPSALGLSDH